VAASLSAPVIFTIAQDLRAMEVHTNVAESDIGRLKPGMRVTFTVDAYPRVKILNSGLTQLAAKNLPGSWI
jgi:HlyD family secretion protein